MSESERDELTRLRSLLADRYAITGEIGRGGMAVVYRADDLKHGRIVAIKVLDPQFGVTLGADRFLREIAIEARLQHPNILALFDSGHIDQYLYYVMPFASGGSLRERLTREGPLPVPEALRITQEVGDALAHAHRERIVHRDVKPENILFSAGHAMVADFGIAQAMADVGADRLTQSGVSLGTPAYMSPEQASGERVLDARSDVYSLGCVLFEMLAGEPPFTGPNPRVVVARHISERAPSIEVARPQTPPGVVAALDRALAKVPADRQPTIDAFLTELAAPGPRPVPARLWRRVALIAATALLLLLGWQLLTPGSQPLSAEKVAVFPLSMRGIGELDPLDGAGIAYLIEAALEHADPLRLLEVSSRLTEAQRRDPGVITAQAARSIAADLGAAHYITGVVQGHRDSTTLILRLHDVRGDSVVDQRSVAGVIGTPLHHLGVDAVLGLLPQLIDPAVEVDLTPLRDRRADAIVLWWQGERAYRHSGFAAALDLYERALVADSGLAIAAVKGAQAANWIHENARGEEMISLALAREAFLPHRYATLARGLRDYFGNRPDSAMHWLGETARAYPDWWEAWAALGEVYYHMLPSAGPLDSLATAAFERGVAADSASPSLFHLAEIRVRQGELADARRLLDRLRETGAEPTLLSHLNLMQACVSDPRAMEWDAHAARNPTEVLGAGKSLAAGGFQLECAEGAFRAILRSPDSDRTHRWGAFLGLQGLLIATGRDLEARLLIDSVSVQTGLARSLYVLGAVAGARMEEPAAALETFARQRFGDGYEGVVNTESLWMLSVWLHHTGNDAQEAKANAQIALRGARDSATHLDRVFAAAVAAREALALDTARALALFAQLPSAERTGLEWGFGGALPPERLAFARALAAQEKHAESLRAASVFDHAEPMLFLQFLPQSLAIRYRAARALGDNAAAGRFRDRLERLHRPELVADQ